MANKQISQLTPKPSPVASTDQFGIDDVTAASYKITVANLQTYFTTLYVLLSGGTMTGPLVLSADPVTALGAATKQYVDAVATGLTIQGACRVATTGALTVTYNNGSSGLGATITNAGAQAAWVIDSVTLAIGDRVLVKDQAAPAQNGIYVVTNLGSGASNWVGTRASDYDQVSEINPGDLVVINAGTINTGSAWLQTATVVTIGTSSISFSSFGVTNVGAGLTKSGNTISVSTNGITNALLAKAAAYTIKANNTNATANFADVPTSAYVPTKQTFASGTGTYTTPAGVTWICVRIWGGGAGGGGASASGVNGSTGGGGGAGGYCEKIIVAPSATYPYAVGAIANGGTAGQNNGTAGNVTTFGTSLLTANGGGAGQGGVNSTSAGLSAFPAAGGTATGGDTNISGGAGSAGFTVATTGVPNFGGAPAFGSSAAATATGVGAVGINPGGGGSGGSNNSGSGAAAGGNGAAGLILVEEHYI